MKSDQWTLRDLLTDQARRYQKKTFLEHGQAHYSYAEVDDRTDRVATALNRLGLRKGDRLAILLPNSPEFVFFFLGAPKIGIVPVPIDPSFSEAEMLFILRHSGASALITQSRFSGLAESVSEIRHRIFVDEPSSGEPPFQSLLVGQVLRFWPDLSVSEPAVISYSQGGKPVVLSHRNLLSNCSQILQPLRIDESDRFLCAVPLSSVAAEVLLLLAPWAAGATCILQDAFASGLLATVEKDVATVLAGGPHLYQRLAEDPGFAQSDLSLLRLAVCNSGPVEKSVLVKFEECHDALIVEGYGPIEATCLSCANPYTGVRKPGSLGLPLPGVECRILTADGREAPPGEPGEIVISGPHVMTGYYRDAESSRLALRDGFLHTGDRGYTDSDGYYFLSPKATTKPSARRNSKKGS